MTISGLIAQMNQIKNEYGDIEAAIKSKDFKGNKYWTSFNNIEIKETKHYQTNDPIHYIALDA